MAAWRGLNRRVEEHPLLADAAMVLAVWAACIIAGVTSFGR